MHPYPIHRYCVWLGACWTLPSRKPGSNAKTLHMRRGARLFAKYSPFSLIWGDTLCTLTCLWQLRLLHKYIFSIFRVKWLWKSSLVRLAHNKILSDAFLMHSECVWRGAKMYLLAKAAMHFPHSFPGFHIFPSTALLPPLETQLTLFGFLSQNVTRSFEPYVWPLVVMFHYLINILWAWPVGHTERQAGQIGKLFEKMHYTADPCPFSSSGRFSSPFSTHFSPFGAPPFSKPFWPGRN